ncbi:MAG: alpha/beta hydrolase [Gammaproteobacteria bacterium]|nr:alpha/beta hydrolase [Gammaproteobacteria bacterium]MBL7001129.1 alpha/beta hydrolase [Gammaproteobacteria bacterium]
MSQQLAKIGNTNRSVKPHFNASGRRKRIVPLHYRMIGMGLNAASHVNNEWAADVLSKIWFTVFKTKPKRWINAFWQQAQTCVELQLEGKSITVSLWGQGPLVVMMHGWSGSGVQFRRLIPGLVAAGYRVALFDAPAHGSNPGKQTNLLEFIGCLLAIQHQIGAVDTVMAHSFGGMAAVDAVQRGLRVRQMVLFAPHLDVQEMFQSYSDVFKLNRKLSNRFHHRIGQKMADIFGVNDIWPLYTPAKLLAQIDCRGLLIYDSEDEEIPPEHFKSIAQHWHGCKTLRTEGLGHNHILKDETVIQNVLGFMTGS